MRGREKALHPSSPAITLALGWLLLSPPSQARVLSFEERVQAQRAIEQVYDRHRTSPAGSPARPSFDARVPRSVIEAKVDRYLRRGAALATYWQHPIAAAELQAEMDRITRSTQDATVLRELFAALHADPTLIAECLARPILTERRLKEYFSGDHRIHADAWERSERALAGITANGFETYPDGELSHLIYRVEGEEAQRAHVGSEIRVENGARVVPVGPEDLGWWRRRLGPAGATVRRTEDDVSVQIALMARDTPDEIEAIVRSFPKRSVDEWWRSVESGFPAALPAAEGDVTIPPIRSARAAGGSCDVWVPSSLDTIVEGGVPAVWTGTEMIAWSGTGGGRYDAATDTWRSMSKAPFWATSSTAVWTGKEMIVWGGYDDKYGWCFGSGWRYDPVADTWEVISAAPADMPCYGNTAVWTGSELILWGGTTDAYGTVSNSGARFDPSSGTWRSTSLVNSPKARMGHTAVWTGSEMIVWGGLGTFALLDTGGRYDPRSDTWQPISAAAGAPSARLNHTAVWSGSRMIVWGGRTDLYKTYVNTGGVYDPAADAWTSTAGNLAPSPRGNHVGLWTGSRMIVWGGFDGSKYLGTGGLYDPTTDAWLATSTGSYCPASGSGAGIWTGREMIVWGGRYDPSTNSWNPVSLPNANPTAYWNGKGIWTGAEMAFWGGYGARDDGCGGYYYFGYFGGDRYDPATDSWSAMTTAPYTLGFLDQSFVWTGNDLIVWGGVNSWDYFAGVTCTSVGARYEPISDTWKLTSTGSNVPSVRGGHTAVWTGSEMIVWGGNDESSGAKLDSGSRYDPVADAWQPTALGASTPASRWLHTAVWTGSEMVVWGGKASTYVDLDSGGRYDPSTDTWLATSVGSGVPSPRSGHTAVWTGKQMIVWGKAYPYENTGARYDPIADAWLSMTTSSAPAPRTWHSAVWTGNEMIVWGGYGTTNGVNTGGRYDPATDTWLPTAAGLHTPSPREGHSAVWTGASMIVWGGALGGGVYVPTGVTCQRVDYLVGPGAGPGNANEVRVYDGAGLPPAVDFLAYAGGSWGTNVAAGAVKGSPMDEILTGPGPGAVYGPAVRAFDRAGSAIAKVSFFAYGTLKYGVNVASGDLDGDGYSEILSGAGPGTVFGPHVRGFDFDNASLAPIAKISYFAYGTPRYGVNVSSSDVDGDAMGEILTAPGPGAAFAPLVRGFNFDGAALTTIAKINYWSLPVPQYGARVAGGDVDADGYDEIASAPGPGPGTSFPAHFVGQDFDGAMVLPLAGFDVTTYATSYGGRVGLGDIEPDGRADLLCGAGPDPAADSTVRACRYTAEAELHLLDTFRAFPSPSLPYGVNVTSGRYGY